MSSSQDRKVTVYLSPEDYPLFVKAQRAYKKTDSKLAGEIIHFWLFSNKLQLEKK